MTELETIAFDIKKPGFAVNDQLTVVEFDADISSRIFLIQTVDRVQLIFEFH